MAKAAAREDRKHRPIFREHFGFEARNSTAARDCGEMLEQPACDSLPAIAAVHRECDFRGTPVVVRGHVAATADHGFLRSCSCRGDERDFAVEVDFDEARQLGLGELLLGSEEAQVDRLGRKSSVGVPHALTVVGSHRADDERRAVAKALLDAETACIEASI
jgi:hypothetical protein